MKSYKNKRVLSRRNKSRRYSRKRKGGDKKIKIGRTLDYRLSGKSDCKELVTKVRKEVENLNNKYNIIELSEKAEQQLNQCPEEGAIFPKNTIQSLINEHNNKIQKSSQYPIVTHEDLENARKKLKEEADTRATELEQAANARATELEQAAAAKARNRAKLNEARDFLGLEPYTGEIPTMEDEGPQSVIPINYEARSSILNAIPAQTQYNNAGPYNGGKKRRHRKKSRKHSRRH